MLIGWTPSQFVSSRSQRAQIKTASITDFMDAEDFEEMGFGNGKELIAQTDYQSFGLHSQQKSSTTSTTIKFVRFDSIRFDLIEFNSIF
jgi:hypothetical protein